MVGWKSKHQVDSNTCATRRMASDILEWFRLLSEMGRPKDSGPWELTAALGYACTSVAWGALLLAGLKAYAGPKGQSGEREERLGGAARFLCSLWPALHLVVRRHFRDYCIHSPVFGVSIGLFSPTYSSWLNVLVQIVDELFKDTSCLSFGTLAAGKQLLLSILPLLPRMLQTYSNCRSVVSDVHAMRTKRHSR
jgi:hypothetical protein